MVFASTYKAPVVLNIVNNQWAISTFQGIARGGVGTFAARGHGFGIASHARGWQRLSGGTCGGEMGRRACAVAAMDPTLIEHVTYRAGGHSTSDDPSAYRSKSEAAAWPLGDPIERLKQHLIKIGEWSRRPPRTGGGGESSTTVISVQKEAEAVGTLGDGKAPSPRDMFEGVYETMPPHLVRQRQDAGY